MLPTKANASPFRRKDQQKIYTSVPGSLDLKGSTAFPGPTSVSGPAALERARGRIVVSGFNFNANSLIFDLIFRLRISTIHPVMNESGTKRSNKCFSADILVNF